MSCRVASPSTVRPSAASPAVAASSSQSSRRAIERTRERGRLRERRRDDDRHQRLCVREALQGRLGGRRLAEVAGVEVERGRRRGRAAVAALRDQHDDDDLGIVRGRVAREDRGVRLARLLRGARLARDGRQEVREHRRRGAVDVVRALLEPRADRLQQPGLERDLVAREVVREVADDARAVRVVLDVLADVRGHDVAAVRDRRVADGDLQGRHLERALADREQHRVARAPLPVDQVVRIDLLGVGLLPPGERRQDALALTRDVDAGRLAEAELPGPVLQRRPLLRIERCRCGSRARRSRCRSSGRARSAGSSPCRRTGPSC